MYMRASAASELEIFRIFTLKNWYFFQYFVGTSSTLSVHSTNDMFVGLHVPTNFQMYRQHSEKALVAPPPPPPSGYASDTTLQTIIIKLPR